MSETTHLVCAHCGCTSKVSNRDSFHPALQLERLQGWWTLRFRCEACGAEYPLLKGIPETTPPSPAALEKLVEHIMDQCAEHGLVSAECAVDDDHPCVIIWSENAVEQITAILHAFVMGQKIC